MRKVSHCHKAALTLLGFCSQCKEPCNHIEDVEASKVEEMLKTMGIDPSTIYK